MIETTHDGHFSVLRLEQIALGEHPTDAAHLADCRVCQARLAAIQAAEARRDTTLPSALRARASVAPPRAARPGPWLAAAAVLLFGLGAWWRLAPTPTPTPQIPPSEFAPRGGFVFEVHVHDGQHSRLAREGEPVKTGDRLGFRVQSQVDGHLMIVGRDADRSEYLCYPQAERWRSVPIAGGAAVTLDEAIELDDVPGDEVLTAVFCEHAFDWNDLPPDADSPDCIRRRLVVHKDSD